MRFVYLLMLIAILLCGTVAFGESTEHQTENTEEETTAEIIPTDAGVQDVDPRRERLVKKMADGFIKAIRKESAAWWECGEQTPEDEWDERAVTMARHVVEALHEYDPKINPWGPWGVIWSESRGNRCSIGPHPRRYAVGQVSLTRHRIPTSGRRRRFTA